MKTWTTAIALIAAGTMLAGSAFAQATAPSGEQKDKAKSGSSMGTDATKDTGKSDMKSSDTMKSDGMKSAKGAKSGHMAKAGNAEHVRAIQQALKDKGHDPGEIDGKMGPKTQAALKDFQSKEGLKATGRMDAETMTKLGVEAKTGAAADTGAAASSPAASPKTDTKADTKADSKTDSSASPASPSSDSSKPGAAAPSATDTTKSDTKK